MQSKKILIVGLPKSGTTALTYKIDNAINNAKIYFEPNTLQALSNVEIHNKIANEKNNVITKCLFYSRQNILLNEIETLYNKKIWIIRDPRDRLISAILYRWYWKHNRDENQFNNTLNMVLEKEKNPNLISFAKIIACAFNVEDFLNEEKRIATATINQIKNLKTNWLVVKYEDLISENYENIESYLNLSFSKNVKQNKTTERVKRTASFNNWKNWFTQKDVELFKPIYKVFFEYFEYKIEWELNQNQQINKKEGSEYLIKINRKPSLFKRWFTS